MLCCWPRLDPGWPRSLYGPIATNRTTVRERPATKLPQSAAVVVSARKPASHGRVNPDAHLPSKAAACLHCTPQSREYGLELLRRQDLHHSRTRGWASRSAACNHTILSRALHARAFRSALPSHIPNAQSSVGNATSAPFPHSKRGWTRSSSSLNMSRDRVSAVRHLDHRITIHANTTTVRLAIDKP